MFSPKPNLYSMSVAIRAVNSKFVRLNLKQLTRYLWTHSLPHSRASCHISTFCRSFPVSLSQRHLAFLECRCHWNCSYTDPLWRCVKDISMAPTLTKGCVLRAESVLRDTCSFSQFLQTHPLSGLTRFVQDLSRVRFTFHCHRMCLAPGCCTSVAVQQKAKRGHLYPTRSWSTGFRLVPNPAQKAQKDCSNSHCGGNFNHDILCYHKHTHTHRDTHIPHIHTLDNSNTSWCTPS